MIKVEHISGKQTTVTESEYKDLQIHFPGQWKKIEEINQALKEKQSPVVKVVTKENIGDFLKEKSENKQLKDRIAELELDLQKVKGEYFQLETEFKKYKEETAKGVPAKKGKPSNKNQ